MRPYPGTSRSRKPSEAGIMAVPKPKLTQFREDLAGPYAEWAARRILNELTNRSVFPETNPEVLDVRGRAYLALDRVEDAAADFWRAYEMTGNESFRYSYARALLCRQDRNAGIAVLEQMAAERVQIDVLYGALADEYLKQGNIPSAINTLNIGLSIPELSTAHGLYLLMISLQLWCVEETDEAIRTAIEAMKLLMNKDFQNIADLPLPGTIELIKQQHFFSYDHVDPQGYYDFLEARIFEARPPSSGFPKIKGLSMLEKYYQEHIKQEEDAFNLEDGSSEANLATLSEFMPYLRETNKHIDQ